MEITEIAWLPNDISAMDMYVVEEFCLRITQSVNLNPLITKQITIWMISKTEINKYL